MTCLFLCLQNGEVPPNRIPRPSSAKGQRRRPSGEGEGMLVCENRNLNSKLGGLFSIDKVKEFYLKAFVDT